MIVCTENEISRLQNNLQIIRHAGGWSTASFGNLLGISKQTVCNLENGISKMNKLQYIGIRTILDYEIEQHPENTVLAYSVRHLLDSEVLTEEERQKTKQAVAYASGAKSTGLDAAMITTGLVAILGSATIELLNNPALINTTTKWLSKLMKGIKK